MKGIPWEDDKQVPRQFSRRALLSRSSTLIAMLGLAGCLNQNEPTEQSVLGDVLIVNRDETPQTVNFRVTWGEQQELVHDSTHDLPADDPTDRLMTSVAPERTWPQSPGRFEVRAKLGDGEWQSVTPATADYPDCYAVVVQVESERLAIFTSTHPNKCSTEG